MPTFQICYFDWDSVKSDFRGPYCHYIEAVHQERAEQWARGHFHYIEYVREVNPEPEPHE